MVMSFLRKLLFLLIVVGATVWALRIYLSSKGLVLSDSPTEITFMLEDPAVRRTAVPTPGMNAQAFAVNGIQPGPFMVVDLAETDSGPQRVTFLDTVPDGGWTETFKTDKLVLLRIPPGTFVMGRDMPHSHKVTLTQPFYIGVFEVTQSQYERIIGKNPSYHKGESHPVESVSWNDLRGNSLTNNWPINRSVGETSFFGRLRALTGNQGFDLPTEAQWEYVCLGGLDGQHQMMDIEETDRCSGNTPEGESHAVVGSYVPNGYGIYDMLGNVAEWCLDWYDDYDDAPVVDPVGPEVTGGIVSVRGKGDIINYNNYCLNGYRVVRGGNYYGKQGEEVTRRYRLDNPGYVFFVGFRVVWNP